MEHSLHGTTGKILRIDLDKNRTSIENLPEDVIRKYLGGTSLGVHLLYNEVPPKVNWADPENRVYMMSGPLGGSGLAGTGCFSVVTKGTHTNGVTSTQANGNFGAYLKFSGFDGVVIQGIALKWSYLYIHDGVAELREAEHLLGKDTWEVEDIIKEELGYKKRNMSVFCIGPAGENLVKFAGLFGDRGHAAAHNGLGAVMGSKRLKAVAVSKSKKDSISIANKAQFVECRKMLNDFFKTNYSSVYYYGTQKNWLKNYKKGHVPVKNYTTNIFPQANNFDNIRDRFEILAYSPCIFCPSKHCAEIKVTEGPYTGFSGKEPEYEQFAAWGSQIGITDPGAVIMLSNEADRLGIDSNEGGWLIGWVMECFEKNLLNAADLDGLSIKWGDAEATRTLLKKIANCKGAGSWLAEGIKNAAEKVGGEAVKLAIYTKKGNTPRSHDHRVRWSEFLDTCVSESATLQNMVAGLDYTLYGMSNEYDPDSHSWEHVSTIAGKTTGTMTFVDSLVICWFPCRGNIPLLCKLINSVTGWDFSFDEALDIGRRAVNLMRMYNLRCGISPELEVPSTRYGSIPKDGPGKGLSVNSHLKEMLKNYYTLMGWDPETGIPLSKTLKKLGIDYTVKDLNDIKFLLI